LPQIIKLYSLSVPIKEGNVDGTWQRFARRPLPSH
jgi:hypothetical protein